jgi:hypothetical protein
MQQEKGYIKYLVIVSVLLGMVFLSQQLYAREFGQNLLSKASAAVSGYWAKGSNWVSDKVYSKVSEEVQKRGEIIKEEANLEKEKISENILEKAGDYLSGIKDSIVNPGKNSCETTQTSQ